MIRLILALLLVCLPLTVEAEEVVSWRGKLETDYLAGWSKGIPVTEALTGHLNLELLLPWSETVSTKVGGDIYQLAGSTNLTWSDLNRLYIRVYRPRYDLTVGRQPLSWGAGMFFNPADPFAGLTDPMASQLGAAPGYSGVTANIPTGPLSRLSIFHLVQDGALSGVKYRANLDGTEVIGAVTAEAGGDNLQVLLQAQGDLGVGWFVQTALAGLETADPTLHWAIGADYSWNGELIVKGELANTSASLDLPGLEGSQSVTENLLSAGVSVQYAPDEFSGYAVLALVTPQEENFMIMPVYTTQLTDVLDLRVYGGLVKQATITGLAGGGGLSYSF